MIDAHHHLWDLAVRDQPWLAGDALAPIRRSFGLADLIGELTDHGIDRTVVVQTVSVPEETPELLVIAAEHDTVAGAAPGGAATPRSHSRARTCTSAMCSQLLPASWTRT
jgi:predicted TIM-barrel fold metal-dependent hydrolase